MDNRWSSSGGRAEEERRINGTITAVELLDDNLAASCRFKHQRYVWLLANIGGEANLRNGKMEQFYWIISLG